MYEVRKGIGYLGQMIEGTYNSPHFHYYGSLFHSLRMMIGHIMDPYHKHGVSTQHNGAIYEQMLKLTSITYLVVEGKKVICEGTLYTKHHNCITCINTINYYALPLTFWP